MKHDEPVKTIMSPDVVTVDVTCTLGEVRRLLAEEILRHLPVVRGRKLVGLLSAADIVRVALSAHRADEQATNTILDPKASIEPLMQTELVTIKPTNTIRDAARHLRSGQFHALPVVDDDGNLEGIVTSTDLIRYLYDQY